AQAGDDAVFDQVRERQADAQRDGVDGSRSQGAGDLDALGARRADVNERAGGEARGQRHGPVQDRVARGLVEVREAQRAAPAEVVLDADLDLAAQLRLERSVARIADPLDRQVLEAALDEEDQVARKGRRRLPGLAPGDEELGVPAWTERGGVGAAQLRVDLEAVVLAEGGVAVHAEAGREEQAIPEADLLLRERAEGERAGREVAGQ